VNAVSLDIPQGATRDRSKNLHQPRHSAHSGITITDRWSGLIQIKNSKSTIQLRFFYYLPVKNH